MKAKLIVFSVVTFAASSAVLAVPVIDVGSHDLLQNTPGQTIDLFVSGADQVTGFNLRAQIGDGTGSGLEPVFGGVSFVGGIWGAYANTVTGGAIGGAEQLAQASVAFNTTVSVPADGLLVTLTVDTTGFFGGSFGLLLSSTEIGTDSAFVQIRGDELAADITNGTINIIPEPASLTLFGAGGLLMLRGRKRR